MKPRFLLDENLTTVIQQQLIRRNSNIIIGYIGDGKAPARGTLDPDILIWIEENNYLLVTDNRRSMPVHILNHLAQGRSFPAILSIRPNATIGQILDELYLIWEASEAEEYFNATKFIPL